MVRSCVAQVSDGKVMVYACVQGSEEVEDSSPLGLWR